MLNEYRHLVKKMFWSDAGFNSHCSRLNNETTTFVSTMLRGAAIRAGAKKGEIQYVCKVIIRVYLST